jgi:HlyD family secretion protein
VKRRNRYLTFVIIAAIGSAILAYAIWPRAITAEVGQVTRGSLQVTVQEDGKTRVKERYVVSAPITGQLSRIELHAGDTVDAGETVLAIIQATNPSLLDARLQTEAEARVKAAEAAEQQALARVEAAWQTHELANDHFQRAKSLLSTNAIPQSEFDEAEHQERIAAESLRAARFALQVAKYEVDLAKSAFVRSRPIVAGEEDNACLEIRSPVSGQILRVMQESAAVVTPGQPLLEVGNPQELEIEIDVLSSDAAQIMPGAKVLIEHWGGEAALKARVRRVEPAGFTKISALGVEEQRVNIIADFDEPEDRLRNFGDAFRIEARIVLWEAPDVIKVPSGALFRADDSWAVFVVQNQRAELRRVKVGKNNGVEGQVLEGLSEGENVIIYPSDDVRHGVRVRKS